MLQTITMASWIQKEFGIVGDFYEHHLEEIALRSYLHQSEASEIHTVARNQDVLGLIGIMSWEINDDVEVPLPGWKESISEHMLHWLKDFQNKGTPRYDARHVVFGLRRPVIRELESGLYSVEGVYVGFVGRCQPAPRSGSRTEDSEQWDTINNTRMNYEVPFERKFTPFHGVIPLYLPRPGT